MANVMQCGDETFQWYLFDEFYFIINNENNRIDDEPLAEWVAQLKVKTIENNIETSFPLIADIKLIFR